MAVGGTSDAVLGCSPAVWEELVCLQPCGAGTEPQLNPEPDGLQPLSHPLLSPAFRTGPRG